MKYDQMPIPTILLAAGLLIFAGGGGCESEASSPAPPAQAVGAEKESPAPSHNRHGPSKSYLGKARDRARDVIDDAEARSQHLADHIDDPTAPMDEEEDGEE